MEIFRKKGYSLSAFYYIIAFISIIILLFVIMLSELSIYIKFILFSIFSILWGCLLGSSFIKSTVSDDTINRAIVGSILVFGFVFILGLATTYLNIDLSFLGGILFVLLSGLIIIEIIEIFYPMSDNMYRFKLYFGLILFSFYVLYDTNMITKKEKYTDFVGASIGLYIDFLNIFVRFISLFNNN
jgi:FtsH-binding integral membrane protein